MPLQLAGSCRCAAVRFHVASHTPQPYQLCYCSICRKTAGGGGFAINIMGDAASLDVEGREAVSVYQAEIEDGGVCETSSGQRHFCKHCATALWMADSAWPAWVYPFASCIDTPLPVPLERVHLMLRFKAAWVTPEIGPKDQRFDLYPDESIEDWHKARGLWVD